MSSTKTSRTLHALLLTTLALVGMTSTASAGDHVDPRIGYKIKVPKGWNTVPVDTDEGWIVAKFIHDKKHFHTDPTSGWTRSIQPTIQVIAFVDEVLNKADSETETEGDETETKFRFRIYEDYLHYMRKTYREGFFVAEENEEEHDGKPVEALVLQTQGSGPPIKILTNIYTVDSGKVAVHIEMLESGYKKMGKDAKKIFRSFEEIQRTEAIDSNPITGGYISLLSLKKLTPKEREIRRKEMARQEWERMVAGLPDDWDSYEIDGIPVVTHADKRHAKKVVTNVVAVRSWLDKTFPEISANEYARPPILRICEDWEEERAFRDGTAFSSGRSTEVVTHKDQSGATGYEWDYVNEQTLRLWFQEKDSDTYNGLPTWFWTGLRELVGEARPKGSKLEFLVSSTERYLSRSAESSGVMPLKDLMMAKRRDFYAGDRQEDGANIGQAIHAMRFFLDGPGAKKKISREVIPSYLRNLRDVLREMEEREDEEDEDEDDEEEDDDKPKTEEEEEEYLKKRREDAQAREQEILEETFHRTFQHWTDRDWETLEKLYAKSY